MCKGLCVKNLNDFVYGRAPKPITCGRDLSIGNGSVVPEINFTLPPMLINESTWKKVREEYTVMIDGVLKRAVHLQVPQLLVEFETLPDMTINPKWGLELTRLLSEKLQEAYDKHGLKNALRLTINDTREFSRPPLLREGKYYEGMLEFLENASANGADMIAIESTGGKEIFDEALVNCDLETAVFALGVLASVDMDFLWNKIVSVCKKYSMIPSGDSACGFANTAMVLAEQKMIPKLFASIIRVASVPRSLVAVTAGAVGPTKDCAYEGPYLKAIAGVPISMEGKSAACAHLTTIGNISQALCDCWSNESVQNVQLLSGPAPVVSMEQLAYDCRLMNTSAKSHKGAIQLRDWLSESDAGLDPQAHVLRPDVVLRVSEKIITETTPYCQTVIAARAALDSIKEAAESKELAIADNERFWIEQLDEQIDCLPDTQQAMIEKMLQKFGLKGKFLPEQYGL